MKDGNPHLQLAIKEAMKSKYTMRVGCVIYKGKKVIATGYNIACHPVRLSNEYLRWKHSLHAEVSAIVYALRQEKSLVGCTLLVVRINRNKELMMAKPCEYCTKAIQDLTPIKKVIYSTAEGLVQTKVEREG